MLHFQLALRLSDALVPRLSTAVVCVSVSLCLYLYVTFAAKANTFSYDEQPFLCLSIVDLKSCQKYFTAVYSSNIAIYKNHFIYLPMQTRSLPFRHY